MKKCKSCGRWFSKDAMAVKDEDDCPHCRLERRQRARLERMIKEKAWSGKMVY